MTVSAVSKQTTCNDWGCCKTGRGDKWWCNLGGHSAVLYLVLCATAAAVTVGRFEKMQQWAKEAGTQLSMAAGGVSIVKEPAQGQAGSKMHDGR